VVPNGILFQFVTGLFGKGFEVGFPSRAPADVAISTCGQDGSRIPVVRALKLHFSQLLMALSLIVLGHSPKPMPQVDTK